MWESEIVVIVAATFLLAGFVKGVIGLGLPTVSLGLLTAALGLKDAIALMLIPSFATNLWQALAGKETLSILKRIWTLLLAACVTIWIGSLFLARSDGILLSGLLGLSLCAYATFSLATPQIPPPGKREVWLSPAIGTANGVLTGLTGSFVVPGVPYLQALGMPRNDFVQAMGILFTVSTVALGVAMAGHNLLPKELSLLSAAALIPAFAGMAIGQWVRGKLSESSFRRVFFGSVLVLGVYIMIRAIMRA